MKEEIRMIIHGLAEMQVQMNADRNNSGKAIKALNEAILAHDKELENIRYRESQIIERLKDILGRLDEGSA